MNELFKNFNNGNQKVSSKEFTAYPTVSFHGEMTLIRGGLEQEISYTTSLYEMNINDLSLFPDVQGASEYCNWKLERINEI